MALTGGFESPFTFAFPLIVGAGALLVAPRIALVLAILATAAYLGAGLRGGPDARRPARSIQMGVNLTGVYLLAYIGASVGREQRRARDAAIRLSTIDSLTGLYNRTFFFTALEREIARGDRSGRAFCLVMLDLDDLKAVNDRFGHVAGDQVLRGVADIVRSGVRKIDVAARYGGDEFVALLPETDPTGGWVLAEKIRLTVAEQGMPGRRPGPDGLGRGRLVPGRRPLGRRPAGQRRPGDVRLEARRQEPRRPGHGRAADAGDRAAPRTEGQPGKQGAASGRARRLGPAADRTATRCSIAAR